MNREFIRNLIISAVYIILAGTTVILAGTISYWFFIATVILVLLQVLLPINVRDMLATGGMNINYKKQEEEEE